MIRHAFAALLIASPGVVILAAGTSDAAAPKWSACKYEDGSGQARCVWDARHMGNGSGKSYTVRHGGTDAAVIKYVSHKRAHALAYGGK